MGEQPYGAVICGFVEVYGARMQSYCQRALCHGFCHALIALISSKHLSRKSSHK